MLPTRRVYFVGVAPSAERTNSKAIPQYGLKFRANHRVPIPLETLACKPVSVACEPSLWPRLSSAPGNGFRTPERQSPKQPLSGPSSLQRLEAGLCARAKSRVFGERQEISFSAGLRGGPGRTQTTDQIVTGGPGRCGAQFEFTLAAIAKTCASSKSQDTR